MADNPDYDDTKWYVIRVPIPIPKIAKDVTAAEFVMGFAIFALIVFSPAFPPNLLFAVTLILVLSRKLRRRRERRIAEEAAARAVQDRQRTI